MRSNSTFHREPRKIITVCHQEILLLKKLRKLYSPKGREGVRGIEATKWPQPYDAKRRLGNRGFPLRSKPQVPLSHAKSVFYNTRFTRPLLLLTLAFYFIYTIIVILRIDPTININNKILIVFM